MNSAFPLFSFSAQFVKPTKLALPRKGGVAANYLAAKTLWYVKFCCKRLMRLFHDGNKSFMVTMD